jgi:hypothetical protein
MIKLTDIIQELEKPKNLYSPTPEEEFFTKGYRTTVTNVDPETGKSESTVEYLPEFKKIGLDILNTAKIFKYYQHSDNEKIAELAINLTKAVSKVSKAVFALNDMVELEKRKG